MLKPRRKSSSQALADNLRRQAESLDRDGHFPRTSSLLRLAAIEIMHLERKLRLYRDRDGSGEAGQTAEQAGPEGQQPGPEGHRP